MSSGSSPGNPLLPVSISPAEDEKDKLLRGDEKEKIFRGSAMTKRGAYAAISYMACAVLLVMFNKAALSSYNFPSANVITLFQSTTDGAVTFVSFETLRHTLPLSASYLLYMLVTMESVRGVNIPMYTTLRRTTVVFTMIMEYVLAGQRYTSPIVGSVALIVAGAVIAGVRDLTFDFYGYGVVFIANITTAIYLATIGRIGKSTGLNSFGLMWCNGVICGPVLLFWTLIRGDLTMTVHFSYLFSPGFLDLFTIGIGWAVFGGLPFDVFNVLGQFLGFFGSGLYAYYKMKGR
ncbi:UDP-N-acetylglucosamine transporter UGNT1 [Linum perenne]